MTTSKTTWLLTFHPGMEALVDRDLARAHGHYCGTVAPGVWEVTSTPDDPEGTRLVQALSGYATAASPPALAAFHLHRVSRSGPLPADLPTLLAELAPLARAFAPTTPSYSVQTRLFSPPSPYASLRPPELNDAVTAALGLALPYDRRAPHSVLSLTLTSRHFFAGVSTAVQNLSPWPGGACRFAASPDSPSRAEHKLAELFASFPDLFPDTPHADAHALDLGAAPGGWSLLLARRGYTVTSVDPADLAPQVLAHPSIRHLRMTAERYLAVARDPVDLLVNDMRMDARDAARLLVLARPSLTRDARAITTLKLPHHRPLTALDGALELLAPAYALRAGRQLFHNRQEVTLVLSPAS